ncbi:diguanylate cyclase [Clostridiaceae bacterium HSG29]|nr:diguanylate cyclase [Clostridiaceae bacterium HSG29]
MSNNTKSSYDEHLELLKLQNKIESLEKEIDVLKNYQDNTNSFKNALTDIVVNASFISIICTDENRIITHANQQSANLLGYNNANELIGRSTKEFYISIEEFEKNNKYYLMEFKNSKIITFNQQHKHKNGNLIWLKIYCRAVDINTPADLSKGIIWIAQDITEQKNALTNLNIAHRELESIFNNSSVGIIMLKNGRTIYRANERAAEIINSKNAEELIGMSASKFHLSEKKFNEFGEKYYDNLLNNSMLTVDYQVKTLDGVPIWIAISGKAIDTNIPPDLNKGVIWVVQDINDRKKLEQKLLITATKDSLTGINNRHHFMELGKREFDLRSRNKQALSILMLDIDHFKIVNDNHGHAYGDKTLIHFTKNCSLNLRLTDTFGRLGGEEFAILLPNTKLDAATKIAERIRLFIEQSNSNGFPSITVSIGIATADENDTIDTLLNKADIKLYQAKENGRNQVIY